MIENSLPTTVLGLLEWLRFGSNDDGLEAVERRMDDRGWILDWTYHDETYHVGWSATVKASLIELGFDFGSDTKP